MGSAAALCVSGQTPEDPFFRTRQLKPDSSSGEPNRAGIGPVQGAGSNAQRPDNGPPNGQKNCYRLRRNCDLPQRRAAVSVPVRSCRKRKKSAFSAPVARLKWPDTFENPLPDASQ